MGHFFISIGGLYLLFAIQSLANFFGIPEEVISQIISYL